MEPMGMGLAAVSMADLCIKYGKSLMTKYRNYQTAEYDIRVLILRVEHHWMKTERQVEFLQRVWSELGEHLQVHQNSILQVLCFKIQEATVLIDQTIGTKNEEPSMRSILSKRGTFNKAKFALKIKECLQKTLDDLATWQGMLDPSWFLMTLLPSAAIDRQLKLREAGQVSSVTTMKDLRNELHTVDANKTDSIFIAADTLMTERTDIPFSFSKTDRDRWTSNLVIVDSFHCHAFADLRAVTGDIRNLARTLSKVDPSIFGLLSCRGVIKILDTEGNLSRFDFVFSIPPNLSNPTSLRSLLLEGRSDQPLNDRLDLAKQLASSVLFIHNSKFVHKNIRPETILVLTNDTSAIRSPFLVGFEKFRPTERATYRVGDARWERNLYSHPKRQGLTVEEDFKMQHDVYSLGVCLLEIGLWTSFVMRKEDEEVEPTPNPMLCVDDILKSKDQRKKAQRVKQILIDMAEDRLRNRMGNIYTDVVLACLTCLDKGATAFGEESEFLDADGIEIAVRYIDKILMRIKEISI